MQSIPISTTNQPTNPSTSYISHSYQPSQPPSPSSSLSIHQATPINIVANFFIDAQNQNKTEPRSILPSAIDLSPSSPPHNLNLSLPLPSTDKERDSQNLPKRLLNPLVQTTYFPRLDARSINNRFHQRIYHTPSHASLRRLWRGSRLRVYIWRKGVRSISITTISLKVLANTPTWWFKRQHHMPNLVVEASRSGSSLLG